LFVLDTHVLRFDFLQVHAGLYDPMATSSTRFSPYHLMSSRITTFSRTYLTVTNSESVWTCWTMVAVLWILGGAPVAGGRTNNKAMKSATPIAIASTSPTMIRRGLNMS